MELRLSISGAATGTRSCGTVTVAPLRDLLTDALGTLRRHESHAEHMVAGLGCT